MSSVICDQSAKLLVDVLGFKNVASPYIDNLVVREDIAAQFLESMCIDECKRVDAFLSNKYRPRSKEVMYWLQFGDMALDNKQKNRNGLLIQLIVESDDVSFNEAMRIIIDGCGFRPLARFIGEKPSMQFLNDGALHQDVSRVVAPRCLVIKAKNIFIMI